MPPFRCGPPVRAGIRRRCIRLTEHPLGRSIPGEARVLISLHHECQMTTETGNPRRELTSPLYAQKKSLCCNMQTFG